MRDKKIGKTCEINNVCWYNFKRISWSFIVFHLNFLLQSIIPHQKDFVVEEEVLLGGE